MIQWLLKSLKGGNLAAVAPSAASAAAAAAPPMPVQATGGGGGISGFMWFIIVLVIFIGSALAYYYYYVVIPNMQNSYNPNKEHGEASTNKRQNKTAEFMLFYATWCDHCKAAKPHWETFKSAYNGKIINGYKIVCTEIDCSSDENDQVNDLMDKYDIKGFPTVKLVKDGQVISFEGEVTNKNLAAFLNGTV